MGRMILRVLSTPPRCIYVVFVRALVLPPPSGRSFSSKIEKDESVFFRRIRPFFYFIAGEVIMMSAFLRRRNRRHHHNIFILEYFFSQRGSYYFPSCRPDRRQ